MGSEKDLLLVGIMVPKLGGSFLDVLGWLPFLKEQKDGIIFLSPSPFPYHQVILAVF